MSAKIRTASSPRMNKDTVVDASASCMSNVDEGADAGASAGAGPSAGAVPKFI
jgi:hypothetical protein